MALQLPDESQFEPIAPSDAEQETAKISAQKLATVLGKKSKKSDLRFTVEEELVSIPQSAAKMLLEILSQMAQGRAIVLIPAHAELTTQEAADALNVSRPFLVKLLEEGKLPYRKVGSHRRVRFSDLMSYRERSKIERLKALEELQKDAQDKDLGY